MDVLDKLNILADAAKYDAACTSSGLDRSGRPGAIGNTTMAGCCHTFSADGRCVSLLKVLLTNVCVYDCQYCVNRRSNDVPRAAFTPRELCELTMGFYRRNYIEGLFLSSAVMKDPDHTTEGMIQVLRLLREEFRRALELMEPEEMEGAAPFSIATGVSAAPFLQELVDMAQAKCGKIEGKVYPIVNHFFGQTITVAGLVTGGDLTEQLRGRELGERLLIPASMLRSGERVFLDDVSLDDVERELNIPVIPVAQDGYELLDAMLGIQNGQPSFGGPDLPEDEYYRYNPGVR